MLIGVLLTGLFRTELTAATNEPDNSIQCLCILIGENTKRRWAGGITDF
jgi:hypothetical protein